MRRLLVALFPLALLLAACGGGDEPPETEVASTSSPSPEPEPAVAPLTGVAVTDEEVLGRPVVAVKIDNAAPARPQKGLNEADVVFEELVEGGSTRFLALFHSTTPAEAGPVRSGRDVDADLVKPYEPLLAISGAAPPTYAVLRGAGLQIREEAQPEQAWARDRGRKRPYNLFTDVSALAQVAAAAELPAPAPHWVFDTTAPAGSPATGVRMAFSPAVPVAWTWDAAIQSWRRNQGGGPHQTADGKQVSARNVVVMKVPVQAGGGVDVKGNATQHIAVVGEGEAIVLRDGMAITGRWRKASRAGHLTFVTASGQTLALAPGRTWVELVPQGAAVTVEAPAPAPATSGSDASSAVGAGA